MKPLVTTERLREVLQYNEATGEFTRLTRLPGYAIGSVAGCVCPDRGYVKIGVDGRAYRAHRLAWLYVNGVWPEDGIDHINGNRADNRICNLREATNSENLQNRGCNKNSKSGLLGVSWHKTTNTWRAAININGVKKHIGHFKYAEMAYAAYRIAKAEFHSFAPMVRPELTEKAPA